MAKSSAMAIGAALGRERAVRFGHVCAKAGQHVGKDVIPADDKAVVMDLAGGVTVADMPGQPRKTGAAHLDQGLVRRTYGNEASLAGQRIAFIQADRFGKIDQKITAALKRQSLAAQDARLVIESHLADGDARPMARAQD